MEENKDKNISNSTAWVGSKSVKCINNVNIPRNTSQTIVLIIFDQAENYYGAFRNEMIVNIPVFRAYGHGEFLGISKCVKCFEGTFPLNSGVAVLSFDSEHEAMSCLQSKTQIRESDWMGVPEMYIVPLYWNILQIDFYDIKNGVNFTKYLNALEEVVRNNGGLIVAGTTNMTRFRGVGRPAYVLIYQWNNICQAQKFNKEVDSLLTNAGAACSTRAVIDMDPYDNRSLD
ncbi:unnamed protein product [Rodentolepis nana]|uniref:Uncharacterized protein n=1 Tax=Rodentolepis nana TaxID=102285 RepID=A0A0R3TVJ2_RODNA|nr:unnamed protein product [Rodentolepis nana]